MKISIIIPIYNVAPYVEECLQSVMSQTYTGDMECILVDDCGTDDSMEIAERALGEYRGPIAFRILHHSHNRGLSAARNTGLSAATGDYLYFMDSDDTIIPECLEQMVSVLITYPQVDIVQAGAISNCDFLDIETKGLPPYSDDRVWIRKTFLQREIIPLTSWNKLISREFMAKYSLSFKEGLIHEDEMFNYLLAKHVRSIAFLRKNTYCYREMRPNGIMQSLKEENSDKAWMEIAEYGIDNMDDLCIVEQYKFIMRILYRRYFTMYKPGLKKRIRAALRKLMKKIPYKYSLALLPLQLPYCRILNIIEHRAWIYKKLLGI